MKPVVTRWAVASAFFKRYPNIEFVYAAIGTYVGRVMPNPDPATRQQHPEICCLTPKPTSTPPP